MYISHITKKVRVISRILLCFHATKFDIDRDKGDVLAKVVIKKRVNVFFSRQNLAIFVISLSI